MKSLGDPRFCETEMLDERKSDQERDIEEYFRRENQARSLSLSPDFIGHLVSAAQRSFVAADRYVCERLSLQKDLEAWREDPKRIPVGFDGWLNDQWRNLKTSAVDHQISEEQLRQCMGLVSCVAEPLGWNDWEFVCEKHEDAPSDRLFKEVLEFYMKYWNAISKIYRSRHR